MRQLQPTVLRTADLWFDDTEQCQAVLAPPEEIATAQDLTNFATGGVMLTVSEVVTAEVP